jgi:hypothetical protein
MRRVFFFVLLFTVFFAGRGWALCPESCELYWSPVTTYTDGAIIDAVDLPLSYIVEWDGVLLPPTQNTFVPLPKPYGHEIPHTARVKAVSARGEESAFSDPFDWSSPRGVISAPDGLGFGVR